MGGHWPLGAWREGRARASAQETSTGGRRRRSLGGLRDPAVHSKAPIVGHMLHRCTHHPPTPALAPPGPCRTAPAPAPPQAADCNCIALAPALAPALALAEFCCTVWTSRMWPVVDWSKEWDEPSPLSLRPWIMSGITQSSTVRTTSRLETFQTFGLLMLMVHPNHIDDVVPALRPCATTRCLNLYTMYYVHSIHRRARVLPT